MSNRHLVHQLLARALLEMRVAAYEDQSKQLFNMADLFHNIPYQLERAQTERDFEEILDLIRASAERKGLDAWLNHALLEISQ
jgi:hypothetical protein